MTATVEERQAAEILRLYDVQAELVKELAHVRFQLNTEQAGHHLDSVIRRLLSDRWLVWPVRLIWKGWPIKLTKKGLRRDPYSKWYSRHGSCYWYGVVQYIRLGPVIVELGRTETMTDAHARAVKSFYRMTEQAKASAETTTQETLQRINRTAESGSR